MKHLLNILTFIFISVSVFGQTDSTIIGKYSFVERKGIPFKPNEQIGSAHLLSFPDTTIKYSLQLEYNDNAVLQIDTVVNSLGVKPAQKWLGKWEVKNDTLYITFTESSMLWLSIEKEPSLTIEKLTSQINYQFVFQIYNNRIYGVELVNDESKIIYTKE